MALPAFAAERRAAAVCCGAVAAGHPPLSIYTYISALETFVIIALYKSTFTIPYHTISWSHGDQQQTRRCRGDRRTGRQTDEHPTVTQTLLRMLCGQWQ